MNLISCFLSSNNFCANTACKLLVILSTSFNEGVGWVVAPVNPVLQQCLGGDKKTISSPSLCLLLCSMDYEASCSKKVSLKCFHFVAKGGLQDFKKALCFPLTTVNCRSSKTFKFLKKSQQHSLVISLNQIWHFGGNQRVGLNSWETWFLFADCCCSWSWSCCTMARF